MFLVVLCQSNLIGQSKFYKEQFKKGAKLEDGDKYVAALQAYVSAQAEEATEEVLARILAVLGKIEKEKNTLLKEVSTLQEFRQFDPYTGFTKKEKKGKLYLICDSTEYQVVEDVRSLNGDIEALDLRGQQLESIPPEVFEQKSLQVLLLSDNNLKTIPSDIKKLKNLRILDLGNNQLKELDDKVFKLTNIETLLLHDNAFDISEILSELPALENLRNFSISGNFENNSRVKP